MSGYHMPCVYRQTAFHTEVFFILQLDENNKTIRHFDSEPALFGPHLPKDGFAVSGSGLVPLCYLNLMSPISNSAKSLCCYKLPNTTGIIQKPSHHIIKISQGSHSLPFCIFAGTVFCS